MIDNKEEKITHFEKMQMTSDVVAAYLSNNVVPSGQISEIITSVYSTLTKLSDQNCDRFGEPIKPAVPVKKSITPDYIVCLEDGKKLKMLKRHLRTTYNLSPEEYREKWGLPLDYPMVAPNYAKHRSNFAKEIGLGRKPGQTFKRKKSA